MKKEEKVVQEKAELNSTVKPREINWKRSILDIINGNFLAREYSIRQAPYVLFLALMTLLYISNNYYAESKIREISKINSELKELRSDYITTKSRLMFMTKQSEIAVMAEEMGIGIKPATIAPKKIIVESTNPEEE
jgi:hypothetical protein